MTRWAAVTTFHADHWQGWARTFVASFLARWPREVELHVVLQGDLPRDLFRSRLHVHALETWAPRWPEFLAKHGGDKAAHGQINGGYDYRHDAIRFAPKVFVIGAAAEHLRRAERLLWIDADIVTHADVPLGWLEAVLLPFDEASGTRPYVAYLGRDAVRLVPETGLLAFDQLHAGHAPFLAAWTGLYASGSVFELARQEDAFSFDCVRRHFAKAGLISCHDLGAGIMHHHVFVNSVLGEVMDHCKGPRKQVGHSHPADLSWPRPEPWWRAVRAGQHPRWDAPLVAGLPATDPGAAA
jgi:hypothetical protein